MKAVERDEESPLSDFFQSRRRSFWSISSFVPITDWRRSHSQSRILDLIIPTFESFENDEVCENTLFSINLLPFPCIEFMADERTMRRLL